MHREQESRRDAGDALDRPGSGLVRTASTQEVTSEGAESTAEDSPEALDGVPISQAAGWTWHGSCSRRPTIRAAPYGSVTRPLTPANMHKLLLSLLPLLVSPAPAPVAPAALDVSKIYGRIQYVDVFPDYTIEVVDAFPDLKVKEVNAFPDAAGKWEIVTVFPDYKIQKVKAFGDFKVQYVDSFPGPGHD